MPDPTRADVRFIEYYIDFIELQMRGVSRGTTQDSLSDVGYSDLLTLLEPTDPQLECPLDGWMHRFRLTVSVLPASDETWGGHR